MSERREDLRELREALGLDEAVIVTESPDFSTYPSDRLELSKGGRRFKVMATGHREGDVDLRCVEVKGVEV